MKNMFLRALSGVLGVFVCSVAFAEEARSNYDGFYVGALGSHTQADTTIESQPYWLAYPAGATGISRPSLTPASKTFSLGMAADGWQGGGVIGYNWDVGQPQGWVLGAELDLFAGGVSYDNSGMRRHVADIGMRSFSVSNQVTARVRAGYDIDGFMPYVAAGVSCANIEAHNVQWMIRPYHQSGRECGASGAVGLEYMFPNSAVSVRGEYRVNDYGSVQTEQGIFGVIWNF